MLAALPSPESPLGIRSRAMLLLGFGAALRRSELVGLKIRRRPTGGRARPHPSGRLLDLAARQLPGPTDNCLDGSGHSPRAAWPSPPATGRRSRRPHAPDRHKFTAVAL